MGAKIGLWIDHRKAVLVTINGKVVEISLLVSKVEKHLLHSGDPSLKGPFKARQVPADDRHENGFKEHLNVYYNEIMKKICDDEYILIFGPGEAKIELKKLLEKNNLVKRIIGIEAADRMTERQIEGKVKKYFAVMNGGMENKPQSPRREIIELSLPAHP